MSEQEGTGRAPTPQERNDDRSRQMNPEDERGQLAADNRSRQLNPEEDQGQVGANNLSEPTKNPEREHPAWDTAGRAGVTNSGG